MAIFIIDQFSLNTDLPLDIRYVPSGGSYNDVSAYWYPGMQVYQTSDETIWYADNSLNWHQIGSGTDASLNALWNYVIDISTQVQLHESSLGNLTIWNISQDSSIVDLRQWNIAQDSSIVDLRTRVTNLETSVGALDVCIGQLDTQIQTNVTDITNLETSVGALDLLTQQHETSLGNLTQWDIIQDLSIANINTDISGLEASIARIDSSITALDLLTQLHETSLGNMEVWQEYQDTSITNLDLLTQLHETSLGNLTIWNISQDASITNLDASLDLYLPLTGGTLTGPGNLTIDGSLIVNGTAVFKENVFFDGSVYFTDVETIDVSSAFIHLNTGLTGAPPANLQSGLIIGRGSAEPYVFIYDETDQTFRIGIAQETSTGYLDASTQAVATREDSPTVNGIAVWNDTLNRFDTSVGLTFVSSTGLTLDSSLILGSYAGAADLVLVVGTNGVVKAIPTWDGSLANIYTTLQLHETSLGNLDTYVNNLEVSVGNLDTLTQLHETSLGNMEVWQEYQDTSITNLDLLTQLHEASLGQLNTWNTEQDASIVKLFEISTDTSVLGAINIGDGSAQVYAGISNDGSLQFREFVGVGNATVTENGNVIEIGLDASAGGEINTASNIGTGEGLSVTKEGVDLPFKSLAATNPSEVIITSDASTIYFDVSIYIPSDASLSGLTDTSINDVNLVTHTNIEYDVSVGKWVETQNGWWDTSLGTTTDDLGGVPQGTDLEGLTLKEILYKILYEYQPPTLVTGSDPASGTYEKGLVSTQFATVDVSYLATTANYPLAKLNQVHITKTGAGTLLDASLGLVSSDSSIYTDLTGITNWGGANRTISYNVTIDDDQSGESQPAVGASESFTFYYRQFWGEVDGALNAGDVSSGLITTVDSSRLAGETTLTATFDYVSGPKIKYLFAYPDTVAAPDNFGILSQITDQNDFDITSSWDTGNVDVSVGVNNIRYRYYLLKNKVDTPTFDVNFMF